MIEGENYVRITNFIDPGTEVLADNNIVDYIYIYIYLSIYLSIYLYIYLWQNLPNNEENTRDSWEQGNDYLDMKNKNYLKKTFCSVPELWTYWVKKQISE